MPRPASGADATFTILRVGGFEIRAKLSIAYELVREGKVIEGHPDLEKILRRIKEESR